MKYIALLRGINVGGNNKVAMSNLKEIFEDLGYQNVRTYINSGNVIFESSRTQFNSLGEKLSKKLGFDVKVLVVNVTTLQRVVRETPSTWTNDKKQKTDVLFLWPEYDFKKVLSELDLVDRVDAAFYTKGAVVWNIERRNQSKSRMQNGFIGSDVYKHMTARNINTVRKIAELL